MKPEWLKAAGDGIGHRPSADEARAWELAFSFGAMQLWWWGPHWAILRGDEVVRHGFGERKAAALVFGDIVCGG